MLVDSGVGSEHLMFDELLAESAPFHGVGHRLLDAHAREPVRLDDEPPALRTPPPPAYQENT